jgi:thioredoxin reductase (NADPH)
MSTQNIRDLVIVGGGPAGLSASLYAARALLDTVTLEQEAVGGQAILTSEIDNYPGLPHTDGFSLSDAMKGQAEEFGADIHMEDVRSIERDDTTGIFTVATSSGSYASKAVILAGGASPREAGFEGEREFRGHGVSYCATCDGMFYRGKQVFVVGGGNSACEEALFLSKFASKVTLLVRKDHLRATALVAREVSQNPKLEVRFNTSLVSVTGGTLLSGVTLRDNLSGRETTEKYDEGSFGVFVFVGRVPGSSLVEGLAELDPRGYVVTDDHMATRTPGLYAAGDVRRTPLRQVITAASDGAVAATSVATFLGQPLEG